MALAAASAAGDGVDVRELMVQGRESAAALDALLQGAETGGICRDIVAEILRCCDRALAVLHAGVVDVTVDAAGRKRKSATAGATTQMRAKRRTRVSGAGDTPAARVEKKCTVQDGFMWRKYGQKGILNSIYPRLYFRCTYKHDSGCPAMKQVQRSEDDPSLYVITYFGEHTCCGDAAAAIVDGGEGSTAQPVVINFGSSSATASTSSPWFSAISDDDVPNESSRSSPAVRLPLEDSKEEFKVTKVESTTPDSQPAAPQLSSSADVSGVSPAFDDLLSGCPDWDYFGESSFDYITDFFDFDDIDSMLQ